MRNAVLKNAKKQGGIVPGTGFVRLFAGPAVLALGLMVNAGVEADELVAYKVVDDSKIEQSLTGKPGDPTKGREVAINRKQGNCLACHTMPIPEQQFHGEVAPDLAGVASRYSEAELRLRVVDPKVLNPDTIMPAFYKVAGLHRVLKKFEGKSILSAEQVEDVIAYLMTLKE
jgi:sulfur-oxidizing protein SoxX